MTRTITGVQLHHTRNYPRAAAHLSNAQQYLKSVADATSVEDEAAECLAVAAVLLDCNRRLWALEQRSRSKFRAFQMVHPEAFEDCIAGRRPWHDENDDVELRCTCHDECLHRFGVEPGEAGVCNCPGVKPPCPRHASDDQEVLP